MRSTCSGEPTVCLSQAPSCTHGVWVWPCTLWGLAQAPHTRGVTGEGTRPGRWGGGSLSAFSIHVSVAQML